MYVILARLYACFLTYICFRSILNLRRPEWDETKRRRNIRDRGIDFADAVRIFGGFYIEEEDVRQDYGETRYKVIGMLDGTETTVVYTIRDCRRRLITSWRSHYKERLKYSDARKD